MTKKKNEVAVWEPPTFEGSDLLPVAAVGELTLVEDIPVVGRENIDPEDMVIPVLALLQGSTELCKQGYEDDNGEAARPGMFHLSSTGEILKPPLRVLLIQHHKSRALFPSTDDPDSKDLEMCLSRDNVTGSKYGDCNSCQYTNWRTQPGTDKKKKPICSLQHTFVVMTHAGPAMLRFGGSSFPGGKAFVNKWGNHPSKNLWSHPAKITVSSETKVLPNGMKTTYHYMDMGWIMKDTVPPNVQRTAYETYEVVNEAWENNKLAGDDGDNKSTE